MKDDELHGLYLALWSRMEVWFRLLTPSATSWDKTQVHDVDLKSNSEYLLEEEGANVGR